jgi:hypothetical protein
LQSQSRQASGACGRPRPGGGCPLGEDRGHLRDRRIGRRPHPLCLAYRVLHAVEHAVEPARELEDVLRLEGGRERLRERGAKVSLAVVGEVLAVADALGGAFVAVGPGDERVHPLDGHRRLLEQHPKHVRRLWKKPAAVTHRELKTT